MHFTMSVLSSDSSASPPRNAAPGLPVTASPSFIQAGAPGAASSFAQSGTARASLASAQPGTAKAPSQANDVLRDYTGAEFLFVSPTAALIAADFTDDLTLGVGAVARASEPFVPGGQHDAVDEPPRAAAIATAVGQLFARAQAQGIAQPVLVGAVPFDIDAAPRLAIARACRHGAPSGSASGQVAPTSAHPSSLSVHAPATGGSAARVARQSPQPATEVYEAAVRQALACFERGELSKVVLARTLALELDAALDLPALMARLMAKNTRGYTYAVPLASSQEVFLGATPELLVRRVGSRVVLNPLAGSAARRADPDDDRAVGQALLQSSKDLQEHAIVIDEIAKVLRPLCRTLDLPAHPALVATDALWHLSTLIEGELIDPDMTSLDLAFALHPTPAVCGYPRQAAFEAIVDLEPFDRGFFAGFVGWMDAAGDGEWAVSLRCAQCGPRHATLSAGAGIVPGSVPERETAETQTKFRTMLSALGLGQSIDLP